MTYAPLPSFALKTHTPLSSRMPRMGAGKEGDPPAPRQRDGGREPLCCLLYLNSLPKDVSSCVNDATENFFFQRTCKRSLLSRRPEELTLETVLKNCSEKLLVGSLPGNKGSYQPPSRPQGQVPRAAHLGEPVTVAPALTTRQVPGHCWSHLTRKRPTVTLSFT